MLTLFILFSLFTTYIISFSVKVLIISIKNKIEKYNGVKICISAIYLSSTQHFNTK